MKIKLLSLCLSTAAIAAAQDFSGYRSGNYTGVNGAFFNPAAIADSRYRFDLNLLSASAAVGNNKATFNLKDIFRSFDSDKLEEQVTGPNAGASSGLINASIHGPSFMFTAGRKMAFALTTRARVMTNITDLDGKLADKVTNDMNSNDPSLPYTIASTTNMRMSANAWTEFGLTVGRVIQDEGVHFFKTGVTFKYLAGAANGYFNIDRLQATIDEDGAGNAYLANTTGRIAAGFGGVTLSDFEADQLLEIRSSGFGADIGFVYEYRPDTDNQMLGETGTLRRDINKYKFKVGLALLDLGRMAYPRDARRSGGYTIGITGNERLYTSELEEVEIDSLKSYFNSRPQYFTPDNTNTSGTYKVGLPTSLHVNVDYHLHRGFYVDLAAQLSLRNTDSKPYNSSYYSGITLTPRYEGRRIGLYVPIGYNGLTKLNAGMALRLGSLFVGSGSALTALLGNSKQADAYMGLRVGLLQKKMSRELWQAEKRKAKLEKLAEQKAE